MFRLLTGQIPLLDYVKWNPEIYGRATRAHRRVGKSALELNLLPNSFNVPTYTFVAEGDPKMGEGVCQRSYRRVHTGCAERGP